MPVVPLTMIIQLIKNRSDIGAGTRGSDLGIDALEIAAINSGNDYFNRHKYIDVLTRNETIYNKNNNTFAKRIEHVAEHCERVATSVKVSLQKSYFPIVLSGDHSSALGTVSGIKAAFPEKTIGVIWIDAHADLHSPFTSPSGNIHGMPVAAALSENNMACKVNEPGTETLQHWEILKNIGTLGAKLLPEHLIYFGLRDYESAEASLITEKKISVFTVAQVREKGIQQCVEQTKSILQHCDAVYISFDVDSMDCEQVSYGTGTPVPVGFIPGEISVLLTHLCASLPVVCLELAEINPLLDNKGNLMAETAFQLLDSISGLLEEKNN
jgi:arginase